MTQTKHTPGPWEVHKHLHAAGEQWLSVLCGAWDITHNKDDGEITHCRYSAMSDEENMANALLIAAAPDLLAALKDAVFHLERLGFEEAEPQMIKIRAEIAKATGAE